MKQQHYEVPAAVEKGRGTLWLVWLIPMVAFVMAGWMVYKYYAEKGVDIVITYDSGNGIEAGKTPLLYKGIKIGTVSDITVDRENLGKINVTVTVDRRAIGAVARRGNTFVKVSPKVTLTEISGLDTILSGVYLEIYPATNDRDKLFTLEKAFHFVGTEEKPVRYDADGIYIELSSKNGVLTEGTPVLHEKFIVGKIVRKQIDEEGIHYIAYIKPEYAWLVKQGSRFWRIDALDIKASLSGVKVSFDSLASVLTGGIAFDSPEASPREKEHRIRRTLYESHEALKFEDHAIVLEGKTDASLKANASGVYYHGHQAGEVTKVTYLPEKDRTRVEIRLDRRFERYANATAHFWVVEPEVSLRGIKGLDALTRGPYVAFDTEDISAPEKEHFTLYNAPKIKAGRHIHFKVDEAKGIREGTPIFYRNIEVGAIYRNRFRPQTGKIDLEGIIKTEYANLVNDTTMFYNRSGIEADLSLHDIHLSAGPVEAIVTGGIAFETLRFDAPAKKQNFRLFKNYKTYKKYRYLESDGKKIKLRVAELGSLNEGAPVLYKKTKAGEVTDVRYLPKDDVFELTLFVAAPYSERLNSSTRFSEVSGVEVEVDFPHVLLKSGSLETMLRGGLSFVTPELNAPAGNGVYGLYDAAAEEYETFSLMMEEGYGVKRGSALLYKDVPVGKVKAVALKEEGVQATVMIRREYEHLLDADTWFWLERFNAGLSGVENASALLSGPAIALRPGHSGSLSDHFALRKAPPPPTYGREGLRFTLIGDRKSSLKAGSPLLYRQVKIGQVESWKLLPDGTGVEITCFVEPRYRHLVRHNAKFYNATAFGMDVSLMGVKVRTETVETMVQGGIGMAVPDDAGELAKEGTRFLLHNAPQEEWMKWKPKL